MKKFVVPAMSLCLCAFSGCRSGHVADVVVNSHDSVSLVEKKVELLEERSMLEVEKSDEIGETCVKFAEDDGIVRIYPDGSVSLNHVSNISGRLISASTKESSAYMRTDSASIFSDSEILSSSHADSKPSSDEKDAPYFIKRIIVAAAAFLLIFFLASYRRE